MVYASCNVLFSFVVDVSFHTAGIIVWGVSGVLVLCFFLLPIGTLLVHVWCHAVVHSFVESDSADEGEFVWLQ